MVGEPRLRLTYNGTGAPADTHVYAQIVDTARNLVLGNVSTPIPVKLDGRPHTIERPLEPVAARAVAGKRYRLQICRQRRPSTPRSAAAGCVQLTQVGDHAPA